MSSEEAAGKRTASQSQVEEAVDVGNRSNSESQTQSILRSNSESPSGSPEKKKRKSRIMKDLEMFNPVDINMNHYERRLRMSPALSQESSDLRQNSPSSQNENSNGSFKIVIDVKNSKVKTVEEVDYSEGEEKSHIVTVKVNKDKLRRLLQGSQNQDIQSSFTNNEISGINEDSYVTASGMNNDDQEAEVEEEVDLNDIDLELEDFVSSQDQQNNENTNNASENTDQVPDKSTTTTDEALDIEIVVNDRNTNKTAEEDGSFSSDNSNSQPVAQEITNDMIRQRQQQQLQYQQLQQQQQLLLQQQLLQQQQHQQRQQQLPPQHTFRPNAWQQGISSQGVPPALQRQLQNQQPVQLPSLQQQFPQSNPQPVPQVQRTNPNVINSRQVTDNYDDDGDESSHFFSSDNDEDDEELIESKMILSLNDPISGNLMKTPIKSRFCSHLECFDMNSFLVMNYLKPFNIMKMLRHNDFNKNDNNSGVAQFEERLGKMKEDEINKSLKLSILDDVNRPNIKYEKFNKKVEEFEYRKTIRFNKMNSINNNSLEYFKCPICKIEFSIFKPGDVYIVEEIRMIIKFIESHNMDCDSLEVGLNGEWKFHHQESEADRKFREEKEKHEVLIILSDEEDEEEEKEINTTLTNTNRQESVQVVNGVDENEVYEDYDEDDDEDDEGDEFDIDDNDAIWDEIYKSEEMKKVDEEVQKAIKESEELINSSKQKNMNSKGYQFHVNNDHINQMNQMGLFRMIQNKNYFNELNEMNNQMRQTNQMNQMSNSNRDKENEKEKEYVFFQGGGEADDPVILD